MYYRLTYRLELLYKEAYYEQYNKYPDSINHTFAIYPKRFVSSIPTLDKTIDYLFMGAFKFQDHLQEYGYNNRKWTIDFAKKHFTQNSLFINTTKHESLQSPWIPLGDFDDTLKSTTKHVVPVKLEPQDRHVFDPHYFAKMSASKFCLCPAGDEMYSMRFYEALMCRTIPIINTVQESYRSPQEAKLNYHYYLTTDKNIIYRADWADANYQLFLIHHTFMKKN